jgi:transposase
VARQEHRRRFWAFIAAGLSSEDAAMKVGVSQPVGFRWFRQAGGMAPSHLSPSSKPPSGRYLSFAEREEIALWRAQGSGVREAARRLGRAASTISRELRRNAATRGGALEYRATAAQWHAERAARRPKRAKLAANPALRTYVQDRLAGAVVAPGGAAVAGPAVPWKGGGTGDGRTGAGAWPGARSRSPGACGSTFPAAQFALAVEIGRTAARSQVLEALGSAVRSSVRRQPR